MYGCESWTIKKLNAKELMLLNCGVGEDSWSPLHCKEIQPVHLKGDQSWVYIGRTDAEAETPILWPPDAKSWLTGKDPDPGKNWGQEDQRSTEDHMVGWCHRLNGYESWTVKKAEHRRIDVFELRCGEDSWESLELQGDPTSPFWRRSALGCLWREWCWSWNSSTLATSCEELTHWKRLWCWEGLGAGGEGDDRGWDGWMASLIRWMWVWMNSGSWWWTGRPGVLWFMGSQRIGQDWVTELNWTELKCWTHGSKHFDQLN